MQQKVDSLFSHILILGDQLFQLVLVLWILGIAAQLIVKQKLTQDVLIWPLMLAGKMILGVISLFTGGERKTR